MVFLDLGQGPFHMLWFVPEVRENLEEKKETTDILIGFKVL